MKRIYEVDPLECPKCKAQIRILAFIQDAHSIKDIIKSQGIPDFQAPSLIPKFIDTSQAIETPSYDLFDPFPDLSSQRAQGIYLRPGYRPTKRDS